MQAIEVTTFNLRRSLTIEDFLLANTDIDAWLLKQPGFVSRRIARRHDGVALASGPDIRCRPIGHADPQLRRLFDRRHLFGGGAHHRGQRPRPRPRRPQPRFRARRDVGSLHRRRGRAAGGRRTKPGLPV